MDNIAVFPSPLNLGSIKLSKFEGGFSMSQSQIVPVKLADNEKNRKKVRQLTLEKAAISENYQALRKKSLWQIQRKELLR